MDHAPPRVLVIDDDPTTLELVRTVLDANGYACLTASGGREALEVIRVTPGILVAVSDIDMPGIDGLSLLEKLNAAGGPTPRVIFLTAQTTIDRAIALRLGAIDFLAKPVRPRGLLEAVHGAVAQVRRAQGA